LKTSGKECKMTPFQIAQTYIGTKELPNEKDNHLILAMIESCNPIDAPLHDEIPWCAAFMNFILKHANLPHTNSLAARSNLNIGSVVPSINEALVGNDIVVLKRTGGHHVGFFAGLEEDGVWILGGNQSNQVSLQKFRITDVLGVRRIA